MKYLNFMAILISACTFSPSQYSCEDTDESRHGFECVNKVWVQFDNVQDVGQDSSSDTKPDLLGAFCGDGLIQGSEQCDGESFKDTCTSLGFESGTLTCTAGCQLDNSACVPKSTCGNGKIDPGEQCEFGVPFEEACENVGTFSGGRIRCSEACVFDTSECTTCGNDLIETNEVCDGEDFGADSCSSILDYEAIGELSCDECLQVRTNKCKPVFTQISAGYGHTCGLRSDGSIDCWGKNNKNQTDTPTNEKFTDVGAGDEFSCGILESQKILCWGSNENSKRNPPMGTFLQIDLGARHGCGLTTNNEIKCWGVNDLRTDGLNGTFDHISVWEKHGCALNGNEISCWGRTASGEQDIPEVSFKSLSVGLEFTCAINTDDEMDCWGKSGNQTDDPAGTFSKLDSSSFHSCAIELGTNFAHCWGDDNGDGQILPPTPPEQYRQITTGFQHTCAITMDGRVQCWGKNDDGESTPTATIP